MACDIGLGRGIKCKDSVGGLANVYFINFGDITGYTFDATNTDVIETITGGGTISAYKYELSTMLSSFNEVFNSTPNGNSSVTQTLVLNINKQTLADHKEIKLLTYGRPRVVIEDKNGNFRVMGLDFGADVTTANANGGAAMQDTSGYEVTLVATEKIYANFMEATNEAGLATAGLTVVSA
jgi:hypothetical protein